MGKTGEATDDADGADGEDRGEATGRTVHAGISAESDDGDED